MTTTANFNNASAVTGQTEAAPEGKGKARGCKPEPPYAWFSKLAVRKIRESNVENIPRALAIYLALVELSSDFESNTFQANRGLIASKCGGASKTTVTAGIEDLAKAKVIRVRHTKRGGNRNEANTFVILSMGHKSKTDSSDSDGSKNNETFLVACRKNPPHGSSGEEDHHLGSGGEIITDGSPLSQSPPGVGEREEPSVKKPSTEELRRMCGNGVFNTLRDQAELAGLTNDLKSIVDEVVCQPSQAHRLTEVRDEIVGEIHKQWTKTIADKSNGALMWSAQDKRILVWDGDDWTPLLYQGQYQPDPPEGSLLNP